MSSALPDAIDAITRSGDLKCTSQIYAFHDYDPYEHNYAEVCNRLGIRVKDDVVLTYPAKSTFSLVNDDAIAELETSLNASVANDFKTLLARFGAFHLPGNAGIQVAFPDASIAYTLGAWQFDDPRSVPMLAISPYSIDCDGDAIGYIRGDAGFGDELFRFHHDRRHGESDVMQWSTRLASSISEFIVSYLN